MGHRTAARLPGRIGAAPQECTGGTGLATRPADGGTAPTAPTALVTLTCCCSPASSGAGLSREEQSPDGMPAHQGQVGKADVMVDAGFIIEGQHCHKKPSEKNDGQPRHDTPTSGSVGEDAAPSKPLARPRRAPASISKSTSLFAFRVSVERPVPSPRVGRSEQGGGREARACDPGGKPCVRDFDPLLGLATRTILTHTAFLFVFLRAHQVGVRSLRRRASYGTVWTGPWPTSRSPASECSLFHRLLQRRQ
jgi:hypothetical protein